MLLSEIKFFQDKYDDTFQTALYKFARENNLGHSEGSNARVVWIDGKSWIWRAWFNDEGFERFLTFVAANPGNPHLPKILSRVREEPVKFKNMPNGMTIKYVKIEKLEPMEPSPLSDAIDTVDLNYLHVKTLDELIKKLQKAKIPSHSEASPEDLIAAVNKYPELFKLIMTLGLHHDANDINSDNVMMRGKVPVIMDPFKA